MAGLSLSSGWQQEGNREDATFGTAVASAGDVDGDGWSDVIIGAPRWTNTQLQEGKAFVYLSIGPTLDSEPIWWKEADVVGALFGTSVATAGDVNGDGYADIIVGSPGFTDDGQDDEGGAFLYLGDSAGTHFVPDWHAEGDQVGAWMGASVASAGDVNGDGYADVIVGAPYYETSVAEEDEGQVFLFYGNASLGVPLDMIQYNQDGGVIAHLGKARNKRIQIYVKRPSPFGRGEKKVELEFKPLMERFDGFDTTVSSLWSNYSSGVYFSCPDVMIDSPYHWRLRLIYNPGTTPFMPASRWVTMPWNGWNEADLRTKGGRVFLPIVKK
jgi:hypothetical protein